MEWPDAPQLHVSGALVSLAHDQLGDGFRPSGARAFEGRTPADVAAGQILSNGVFTRTELTGAAYPGDSYTVLQYILGNQNNAALKVQVVQTVGWNLRGVRDMRADVTPCEIGRELQYLAHQDPEGKAGQILHGKAFDGVYSQIDLASFQNTVDGLVAPAHIQDTRQGPIIPILNTAPTFSDTNLVNGGHDLRVAWYRTDARNVAWPVKTVGYRCLWPTTVPEIVIASELGSEIGGQPVLNPDGLHRMSRSTISRCTDMPGFNPNDEHALLAASNLGNSSAGALCAAQRSVGHRPDKAETSEPYALLKYRDPRDVN